VHRLLRIVAVAAACVIPAHSAAIAQSSLFTLRVASTSDDQVTPVLYAVRTGRFRRAGLDVRIERGSSGRPIATGVGLGTYDIGKASVLSLMVARERGKPFVLIAPGGISDSRSSYGLLITSKKSPIRTAPDLNGKTIATASLDSVERVAAMAWVDKGGGDSRTLKFLTVPQTDAGAAIEQHLVDAANTVHPQVDAILATGRMRVLANAYPSIAPQYYVSAWFADGDWASKHADVVATFVRVVRETAAYTNEHHAETAPMLAQFSGYSVDVVRRMTRAVAGTSLEPALVQPIIDAGTKYGVLHHAFPAQTVIYAPKT